MEKLKGVCTGPAVSPVCLSPIKIMGVELKRAGWANQRLALGNGLYSTVAVAEVLEHFSFVCALWKPEVCFECLKRNNAFDLSAGAFQKKSNATAII